DLGPAETAAVDDALTGLRRALASAGAKPVDPPGEGEVVARGWQAADGRPLAAGRRRRARLEGPRSALDDALRAAAADARALAADGEGTPRVAIGDVPGALVVERVDHDAPKGTILSRPRAALLRDGGLVDGPGRVVVSGGRRSETERRLAGLSGRGEAERE